MPIEKPCEYCGVRFTSRLVGKWEQRFCSLSCSSKSSPRGNNLRKYSEPSYYKRNADAINHKRSVQLQTDPLFKKKCAARVNARRVHPVRQPCETCGHPNAQRHHDDYSKPKEIRWLCPSCHMRHHRDERKAVA